MAVGCKLTRSNCSKTVVSVTSLTYKSFSLLKFHLADAIVLMDVRKVELKKSKNFFILKKNHKLKYLMQI